MSVAHYACDAERRRDARLARLLILVCFTPMLTTKASAATPSIRQVVVGSGTFDIPFNVSQSGESPSEVRLYVADPTTANSAVSSDARSAELSTSEWKLLDRQMPEAGFFRLTKVPDGTFWFATETVGRSQPPPVDLKTIRPGLQIVVDTQQPKIDLIADASADGRVRARFEIRDATPTRVISVYFATDVTRKWELAMVENIKSPDIAGGGQFDIQPDDDWHQMEVQIRVIDAAGNEATLKRKLKKPRVATRPSTRFASGPVQPSPFFPAVTAPPAIATPTLPMPATAEQISRDFGQADQNPNAVGGLNQQDMLPIPGAANAMPRSNPETIPTPDPSMPELSATPQTAAEAMRPILPTQPSDPLPADIGLDPTTLPGSTLSQTPQSQPQASSGPLTQQRSVVAPETPFVTSPSALPDSALAAPEQDALRPSEDQSMGPLDSSELAGGMTNGQSDEPVDQWTNQRPSSRQQQIDAPERSPASRDAPTMRSIDPMRNERVTTRRPKSEYADLERLAQQSPVRYSDSNQFSLDYEIEAIGARGVEAVELYGSLDGGQTWKLWGADPDRATPFDIETAGEGNFAFRIVVVAANGLASPRPQPGDIPEIVIVVDETRPTATITGARYGDGDQSGSLVIQYDCDDAHLVARPVSLSFAESTDGPWTTIAGGLRNLGSYAWPADSQLPRQIYLRLDVADEAGNLGTHVLDRPIDTRGLAPRARIRAFRPISTRQP
ncbi:MAG: hypothetical protein AAF539_12570 [Planctomycetota bacterium]